MKINKQVTGGFFGENSECTKNDSLQILAKIMLIIKKQVKRFRPRHEREQCYESS